MLALTNNEISKKTQHHEELIAHKNFVDKDQLV